MKTLHNENPICLSVLNKGIYFLLYRKQFNESQQVLCNNYNNSIRDFNYFMDNMRCSAAIVLSYAIIVLFLINKKLGFQIYLLLLLFSY